MTTPRQTLQTAYIAWMIVCVVWGTTYLAVRVALETIPPALVGGLRFTAAGLILALILVARGEFVVSRRSLPGLALLGFLMMAVGNGAVIWAEQWVPSGFAALVVATTPFWVNGLEAIIPGGQRLTLPVVIGLPIGFAGIAVLLWPDLRMGGLHGEQFLLGLLALQVASLGWSVGTLYSRRHAPGESALGAAAVQMIFGGLMMLGIATFTGDWNDLRFSVRSAAAELYLTFIGSLVTYSAFVYAVKHLPPSTVSLYSYVNPLIAVCLGALLIGEPFGWRVVAASALVLGSVLIARLPAARWTRTSRAGVLTVVLALAHASTATAQEPSSPPDPPEESRLETAAKVLAGAALGLAAHEGGHLTFDLLLGASPGIKRVSYAGVPFFAITHEPVSPAREFAISSAGFWVQHASSELLLSRRPRLRYERAPLMKGMLAFNVLVSVMYAGASIGRTGPAERDTRGMAVSARIDEPWVAGVILAPAVLDTVRYFRPESRAATWASRVAKVGGVLLILRTR